MPHTLAYSWEAAQVGREVLPVLAAGNAGNALGMGEFPVNVSHHLRVLWSLGLIPIALFIASPECGASPLLILLNLQ